PCYYLIAISNRHNLDLCIRHALAGFSNSRTGVWTFVEVKEGDFVSFLHGARAHNLYQVIGREAIKEFETAPPWPPISRIGPHIFFPIQTFFETDQRIRRALGQIRIRVRGRELAVASGLSQNALSSRPNDTSERVANGRGGGHQLSGLGL